jgi:hypothetical protein
MQAWDGQQPPRTRIAGPASAAACNGGSGDSSKQSHFAMRANSVMPLASTLMAWTSEPLACPHCEAQIHAYEDVLTLFLSRVELIVVGCAACRKVLGVLPPAKVDYWPMFGRRRWALRWFPVRRKAFRGADLPGRAGLPGGARGESLPAGTRRQDTA